MHPRENNSTWRWLASATCSAKRCHQPGCLAFKSQRYHLCVKDKDRTRGTAPERGYDADWERVRGAYLAGNPVCPVPGCGTRAVDVDHKVSVREALHRQLHPFNLRGFCKSHYAQRTSRNRIGRDSQERFAERQEWADAVGLVEDAGGNVPSPGMWDFLL